MATPKKISELTTAGPLTGSELVPVVQNSGTLQTTVSAIKVFSLGNVENEVALLDNRVEAVSALATQTADIVASIQTDLGGLTLRIAAVSASVSALNVRVSDVQASISTINSTLDEISATNVSLATTLSVLSIRVNDVSAVTSVNAAAITSINNTVSALEIRVSVVSATNGANSAAITSINAVTSSLDNRVSTLEAIISSVNVSAIEALASAVAVFETEVSALDIRVAAVSAAVSVNAAAITSINAVVSTKVNRVGDFMDSVQYIEFDTSTIVSSSAGRLSWSIEEGTLDIGFDNQGVILHTGLQLYQRVYNDTASTLTKGTVIRVTGSQGQRLTAAPALADDDANSATTFAVMAENVSVNNSGFALTEGVLKNINTTDIPDGTTVWLSPTSAGQFTQTKPIAPQHLVLVGFVVKGNSTGGGSLYVKIINGFELGELHDVKVSSSASLVNGEVLAYDTSAGVWTNSVALINAQASISALDIRVAAVSASVSALQVQLNDVSAALTSTNNVVSALEIRVSAASAQGVVNANAIASTNNVVSALEIRVSSVSAAAVSTNNVVSALEIRVSAASATGAINTASIVSINAVLTSILAILTNTNFRITES